MPNNVLVMEMKEAEYKVRDWNDCVYFPFVDMNWY